MTFALWLVVLLLLSVSRWLLEGFDDQAEAEAEGTTSGCWPVNLDGHFYCNFQTVPVTGCLGNVISNFFFFFFLRQTQGTDLGGQGICGPTSPPVHLKYTTLILLGLN